MRESLLDFCLRTQREELLREWDNERNAPLTPATVSHGSKKRVWWCCANGHRWQAAVHTRTGSGTGCPYCSGRYAIAGENDLATVHPALAKEWHPEKNGDLTPSQVLPGSHRLVWWRCAKGHAWRAQIKSRVNGTGCPICANKQLKKGDNDLASRRVWWQCAKGHAWQASVASRVNGSGCPVCAGKVVVAGDNDLASQYPHLAREWHPVKNGSLTPEQVAPASNRKVWWRCPQGHDYQAVVASRTQRGNGCPYCSGRKVLAGFNDLATKYPEVAKEWHPTLNSSLTPQDVTPGSRKRVWWQCSQGHTWKAIIYSRTGSQRCGCPVCSEHTAGNKRHS